MATIGMFSEEEKIEKLLNVTLPDVTRFNFGNYSQVYGVDVFRYVNYARLSFIS